MSKKKKKYPENYPYVENDELFAGVASATEATGLTAIPPIYTEQTESYRDIFNLPLTTENPPEKKNERDL